MQRSEEASDYNLAGIERERPVTGGGFASLIAVELSGRIAGSQCSCAPQMRATCGRGLHTTVDSAPDWLPTHVDRLRPTPNEPTPTSLVCPPAVRARTADRSGVDGNLPVLRRPLHRPRRRRTQALRGYIWTTRSQL
jgi:hypothetical protein